VSKEKTPEGISFDDDLPDLAMVEQYNVNQCLLMTEHGLVVSNLRKILLSDGIAQTEIDKIKGTFKYGYDENGMIPDKPSTIIEKFVPGETLQPASSSIQTGVIQSININNSEKIEDKVNKRRIAYRLSGGSKLAITDMYGTIFDIEKFKESEHAKLAKNALGSTRDEKFLKIAIMSNYKHSLKFILGQVASQPDQVNWSNKVTSGQLICVSSFFNPTSKGEPYVPDHTSEDKIKLDYTTFFENLALFIGGFYSENAYKNCEQATKGLNFFISLCNNIKHVFQLRDIETSIRGIQPVRIYEHVSLWLDSFLSLLKTAVSNKKLESNKVEDIDPDEWDQIEQELLSLSTQFFSSEAIDRLYSRGYRRDPHIHTPAVLKKDREDVNIS
jgi:hypothetical protein